MANTEDELAIFREIQAFTEAWSRGDAKAAASFYTEDGVRVGAGGDVQRGRAEVEAAYERMLHGPFDGARVTQERGTVKMLGPDLAVWRGGIHVTPGASGASGASIEGYVMQIMKKVGGRWLVLEAHPKLYPPTNPK